MLLIGGESRRQPTDTGALQEEGPERAVFHIFMRKPRPSKISVASPALCPSTLFHFIPMFCTVFFYRRMVHNIGKLIPKKYFTTQHPLFFAKTRNHQEEDVIPSLGGEIQKEYEREGGWRAPQMRPHCTAQEQKIVRVISTK